MEYINFEKKQVNVKQHLRKGKLIKASKRNVEARNKKIKKTVITAATILGLSTASYFLVRNRYIKNLNNFSKNLKFNEALGEKVAGDSITFTFGGFSENAYKSSINLADNLKENIPAIAKDKHSFVAIKHSFAPVYKNEDGSKRIAEFISKSFKLIGNNLAKGFNKESYKAAEEIYAYAIKNPGKPINLIGHSGGGILAKDIQYILQQKNINSKLITFGAPDFLHLPTNKRLEKNFYTSMDFTNKIASSRKIIVKSKNNSIAYNHKQLAYLENDKVLNEINNFFYI